MGNTDKFEMIAHIYDTADRIQLAAACADAIREYGICEKGKTAIDFGCGTGLVGMNLLEDFKSVLFWDTSQNMIDEIKQKISSQHLQNADTLCFDIEVADLSDLHADYIFMSQVLLHIKDFQSVLRKLYEILNPDGHLIIIDFDKNDRIDSDLVHNGFNQEELAKNMSEIGYKKIHSKTFYQGSHLFMGQDATLFILDSQKISLP